MFHLSFNDLDRKNSNKINELLKIISKNAFTREFIIAKTEGIHFSPNQSDNIYIASEICFLKFSFIKGITKRLTLFPDVGDVPSGYRQNIYDELEETIGWSPISFRKNHSLEECAEEIKQFLSNSCGPIFVPTKKHKKEIKLTLFSLYKENKSFDYLQSGGKIYLFEYLIALLLNQYSNGLMNDKINCAIVLDYWKKMKFDIAPETCERHLHCGLSVKCATNTLIKNLYGSFVMLKCPEMPDIRRLVSLEFYNEMDSIMCDEEKECVKNFESDYNECFRNEDIENILISVNGITIKSKNDGNFKQEIKSSWCSGRGGTLKSKEKKYKIPGSELF